MKEPPKIEKKMKNKKKKNPKNTTKQTVTVLYSKMMLLWFVSQFTHLCYFNCQFLFNLCYLLSFCLFHPSLFSTEISLGIVLKNKRQEWQHYIPQ